MEHLKRLELEKLDEIINNLNNLIIDVEDFY